MIWNDATDVRYNGATVQSVMYNGAVIWPTSPTPTGTFDTAIGCLRYSASSPEDSVIAYTFTDNRGVVVASSDYTTSTSDIVVVGEAPFTLNMSGSSKAYTKYFSPMSSRMTGFSGISSVYTQNTYSADGVQWSASASLTASIFNVKTETSPKYAYVSASSVMRDYFAYPYNYVSTEHLQVIDASYDAQHFDPTNYFAAPRTSYRGYYATSTNSASSVDSALVIPDNYVQTLYVRPSALFRNYGSVTTSERCFYLASSNVNVVGNQYSDSDLQDKSIVTSKVSTSTPQAQWNSTYTIDNPSGFDLQIISTGTYAQVTSDYCSFKLTAVIR